MEIFITLVTVLTGIGLALYINSRGISVYRFLYKTLYIVLCALIGLPIGLIWGMIEEPFKRRFSQSRVRRYAVYSRCWHIIRNAGKITVSVACSLPVINRLVAIERKSRRASARWWNVSTLNPTTRLTCWRPLRTITRLYGDVYRSAKQKPYSVIRGLSIGAWIASRLPKF
jgi:hypothetical protein